MIRLCYRDELLLVVIRTSFFGCNPTSIISWSQHTCRGCFWWGTNSTDATCPSARFAFNAYLISNPDWLMRWLSAFMEPKDICAKRMPPAPSHSPSHIHSLKISFNTPQNDYVVVQVTSAICACRHRNSTKQWHCWNTTPNSPWLPCYDKKRPILELSFPFHTE